MYNKLLDQFAQKEFDKSKSSLLGKEIFKFITNPPNKLPLDLFEAHDDICIFVHPPIANQLGPSKDSFHSHGYFELAYLYRGSGKQYTINDEKNLSEGSLCLLNTNIRHTIILSHNKDILFNILIDKHLFTDTFLTLIKDNDLLNSFIINSLFTGKEEEQYIYIERCENSHVEILVQSLLYEYVEKKPCYQASMKSYLLLLFTEFLRSHSNQLKTINQMDTNFTEIMAYINNNLTTISLKDTADHFHYNPSYLSSLFKKYTNSSFSEIVQELKLEKACSYLKSSSLSIDAISELLGYYDRSYFNRVFKKKHRVSPGIYRKANIYIN